MIKRLTFILLALTTLVSIKLLAAPTLTTFSNSVNTVITPEIVITFDDLKNQGDESADTGSLRIGIDPATNFLIDTSNKSFWTADPNQVRKSLAGFSVVAKDNQGASSATNVEITLPVELTSSYTVSLKAGWNMIGGVSQVVDFSDPADNPDQSILPGTLLNGNPTRLLTSQPP